MFHWCLSLLRASCCGGRLPFVTSCKYLVDDLLRVGVLRCYEAACTSWEIMRVGAFASSYTFISRSRCVRSVVCLRSDRILCWAVHWSLLTLWGGSRVCLAFSNLAASGLCVVSVSQRQISQSTVGFLCQFEWRICLSLRLYSDIISRSCTFSMKKRSRKASSDHNDGVFEFMQIYVLCS